MQLDDGDDAWLNALDGGIDRLPSDLLDSLVPVQPPTQPRAPQRAATPPPPPPVPEPEPQPAPQPVPQPAPTQYVPQPPMAPYAPYPAYTYPMMMQPAPVPAPQALPPVPLDINSYVPRSLQPRDPVVAAQTQARRVGQLALFREKKRNRQVRKTVRYASRKAYAEVRPRIKGRFARKDEVAAMRAAGLLPPV